MKYWGMYTDLPTWPASASKLVATAAGREPADLVIKGGTWVNVHTRETLKNYDIAIREGRFAYCGPNASHCVGEKTEIIENQANRAG